MHGMFNSATSFNGEISKWDVSKVINMNHMFWQAKFFKRRICGASWVNSKASQIDMFTGSPGGVCTIALASRTSLKHAIVACLKLSPNGDCFDSQSGSISEWEVSAVTNMDNIFDGETLFNGDISKWDVSAVTTMSAMFAGATSFNGDLSKWDVSSVIDMGAMFRRAPAFNGDLSAWDMPRAVDMSATFAHATSFNGEISNWNVSSVNTMTSMFESATSFKHTSHSVNT